MQEDLFEKKRYCLMKNGDVLEIATLYSAYDIDYALVKVMVEIDNDLTLIKVRIKIKPENIINKGLFEERYKNKLVTKLSETEFEAKPWTEPTD